MIATAARIAKATPRSRRAWAPNADDHQIYRWVRFDGKSQVWAANQLGISQATVSRVLQRYERWQAHADPREGGRLDPTERARAQRWLTFERNELILASCLRIAQEMEGFTDVSKSTIHRPLSKPSQENEVRTEWSRVDRSGVAARFYRLAYRINMEQQKLVQLEPPAMPEPLTDEQLAEQEAEAAAAHEEIEAVRRAGEARAMQEQAEHMAANGQWEALRKLKEELAAEGRESEIGDWPCQFGGQTSEVREGEAEPESIPFTRSEAMHNVHNLHSGSGEKSDATGNSTTSCDESCRPAKTCTGECIAPAGDAAVVPPLRIVEHAGEQPGFAGLSPLPML